MNIITVSNIVDIMAKIWHLSSPLDVPVFFSILSYCNVKKFCSTVADLHSSTEV